MRYPSDPVQESKVLFVPLSTLLLEVESSQPRRNVCWEDWGLSGARMISREPSETWVCYTYGMKFVHGLPREAWQQAARVYDFNSYAARKYVKSTINPSIPWEPLMAASEPSARCEICQEDIITTLPGRVTNFELGDYHGAGGVGWEALMIGEDHILMVQVRTSIRTILIILKELISSFLFRLADCF